MGRRRTKVTNEPMFQIEGVKELVAMMEKMEPKAARPALASGLRKGMAVLRKAIRSRLHHVSTRGSIKARFKKYRKWGIDAKVGGGVGPEGQKAKASSTRGVGISQRNIHWYLLGTGPRATHALVSTGRMPQNPAVNDAWVAVQSQVKKVTLAKMFDMFEVKMKRLQSKTTGRAKFNKSGSAPAAASFTS